MSPQLKPDEASTSPLAGEPDQAAGDRESMILGAGAVDRAGDIEPLESVETERLEQENGLSQPIVPRWAGWLTIVAGLALFPRVALFPLARQETRGDKAAWIGFGLVLCVMLVRTGWLGLRGREHMELTAAAAGTLLVVDAWFEVMTASAGRELQFAVLSTVLVQLPLAGLCLWIPGRVEFRRRQRARLMAGIQRRVRRRAGTEQPQP